MATEKDIDELVKITNALIPVLEEIAILRKYVDEKTYDEIVNELKLGVAKKEVATPKGISNYSFKVGDEVFITKGPFKDFYGEISGYGTEYGKDHSGYLYHFTIDKLYSPDGKTTRTMKGLKADSLGMKKKKTGNAISEASD